MPLPSNTAVVLLPPGHAKELVEIAREWTASWLLTPAVYVDLSAVRDDVSDIGRPPLIVPCQVVGRNGVRELDLFAALARYESDVLRLIAVRLIDQSPIETAAQDQCVRAVRDTVHRAGRSTLRLVTVNLVVAPTNSDSADSRHLLQSGWTANVIASPEDRESLLGLDRFTRASSTDHFSAFTLSHAAAAAGLWAGCPTGPYDGDDTTSPSQVIVQRVAVRGVFVDGMLVDVATAAAQRLTDADLMKNQFIATAATPLQPLPAADVDAVVARLVQDSMTLDGEALRYLRVPASPIVERRRVGLVAQFGGFAAFSWDALRSVPQSIAAGAVRGISGEVSEALHGQFGEAVVVVDSWMPTPSRDLKTASERLDAQRVAARAQLNAPLPRARGDLHPRLWSALRQLSFAALDGSQMPAGVRSLGERAPTIEVLPEVATLVPDRQDMWSPAVTNVSAAPESRVDLSGDPARWYDESSIVGWSGRLELATSQAQQRSTARSLAAESLRTEWERLEEEWRHLEEAAPHNEGEPENLRVDSDPEPTSRASVAVVDIGAQPASTRPVEVLADAARRNREAVERRLKRARVRADAAAANARCALQHFTAVSTDFAEWHRFKQKSWAMQLQGALGSERIRLGEDWDRLRASLDTPPHTRPRDLRELHDRFVRRVVWATLIAVLGTVLVAVGLATLQDKDWWKPWLHAFLAAGGKWGCLAATVWLCVVLASLLDYHRAISERGMLLRRQLEGVQHASAAVLEIRGERVRIDGLAGQLPEFLLLLSEVAHRPWIVETQPPPNAGEHDREGAGRSQGTGATPPGLWRVPRPCVTRLPGHIRLAEPVTGLGDPGAAARVREAVSVELRPGWRSKAFTRLLEISEKSMFLAPGSLHVDVIDRDAQLRRVLLDSLGSTPAAGDVLALGPQARLGAEMVRKIAAAYHAALLGSCEKGWPSTFPSVREMTQDPVQGIDLRLDQLADPDYVPELDWNSYLSELLAVPPEMSWYELGDEVKAWIHGHLFDDALRATIVAPTRLLGVARDGEMSVHPLAPAGALPVELVVRLDQRTVPGPSHVVLFGRGCIGSDRVETESLASNGHVSQYTVTGSTLINY